ncbi:histone-lysine N-methyltransferase 2A [Eucyclogobius newberryi]|uniref:histone-lysine N-methyltransferase 2A n=1 Tax=Eucyclogobius newberryi TaxID=166745 RepID=UPI003B5AC7FC
MAHSCRWRFPARPGGSSNSGTGRKAGRIRVTASLQSVSGAHQNAAGLGPGFDAALQVSSVIRSNLQKFRHVLGESSDSSSGEDEMFRGFGSVEEQKRIHSPSSDTLTQDKKPRGRPPRVPSTQKLSSPSPSSLSSPTQAQPEPLEKPAEKVKRLPGRPPGAGEKRRGRPPSNNKKTWGTSAADDRHTETELDTEEEDGKKDKSHGTDAKLSKVSSLKRVGSTKLSPLKSRLKTLSGVPRRRRGRPPSAERLKAEAAAALLRNEDGADDQDSSNAPVSPSPSTNTRIVGLRKSPRHRKPVRIVPSSKRTDATIAKQLLQRAKKGAQKRLEKEANSGTGVSAIEAGIRKTQLKNIRQFIMPVVSTVSLRIIKTPKRFIEDEGSFGTPQMKMPRLETTSSTVSTCSQPTTVVSSTASPVTISSMTVVNSTGATARTDSPPPPAAPAPVATIPSESKNVNNDTNDVTNGRFSTTASCGSSAVSQHSSQLSSAESSRSSSPSLEDSTCESQGSEGTQALSEPEDHSLSLQEERETNEMHGSRPLSPPSEPEPEHMLVERNRRGHRGQEKGRGSQSQRVREIISTVPKKPIISPPTGVLLSSTAHVNIQQASSTASSSSSPPRPPLLSPPQLTPSVSNTAAISEHHAQSPWISHSIPPFCSGPSVLSGLADKRSRSILREPTFRWTSPHPEQRYFSSAKYAKEGLIRKPIFDNFRPPPLTPEDVGLIPQSGTGVVTPVTFPVPSSGGGTKTLFGPLQPHLHTQQSSSRFDAPLQKRSPLLRAPLFTPSEAHSRIFESVTLQSSSGSSPGSLSPQQSSPSSSRNFKRKRRLISATLRGHLRSPSHSMTRRSSQIGGQTSRGKKLEKSLLSGSISSNNPSSIPGVSASPLTASALTPFSTFSTMTLGLGAQATPEGRRGAAGNTPLSTTASTSSPLFPIFPTTAQDQGKGVGKTSKERGLSAPQDSGHKEKDSDKTRDKEKENNRESRKDLEKRSKVSSRDGSPSTPSSHFSVDGKESEVLALSSKKTLGRKKLATADTGSDSISSESRMVQSNIQPAVGKGIFSKKGRISEKGVEVEIEEKEKQNGSSQQTASLSRQPNRQLPVSSVLAQAEKQPVTDKHVVGLLKKAKAQLFKIEKNKMKLAEPTKVLGQESDSSETSVRGPRIKHVCRRAAVALGRNRAVFPDDMPTLSALPWEEREKILSSMGNDDKSSVAGSEEAEPQSPPIKPRETRHKPIQEAPPKKGRRSRRCGQCSGCQIPEDCGECTNCLDKPKFGGRNIKKQCCKMRKCQNLQWMPSKMFLSTKQGKSKKDKRKNKVSEKKDSTNSVKGSSGDSTIISTPPSPKEEPLGKKPPEDKLRQQPSEQSSPLTTSQLPVESSEPPVQTQDLSLEPEVTNTSSLLSKNGHKALQSVEMSSSSSSSTSTSSTSSSSSSSSAQNSPAKTTSAHQQTPQLPCPTINQMLSKKESPKIPSSDPRRKLQQSPIKHISITPDPALKLSKRSTSRSVPPSRPKDKALTTKPPSSSNLNWLSTPSTRGPAKSRAPCDGVHRIRVDFKRDHDVDKVWEAGGLSVLTSVPATARALCFLCASSGNVEFVYCQVCCEPFHLFCLGESERPLQEQFENWCCRRCRFCQACGRQHQKTKQPLLECDKCHNSYHPECLGPNHPTRLTKKKKVWVCSKCVCCKSCGSTKPGKSWNAQWSHDFSMCHDCAKVAVKGKHCLLCDKCYDEEDDGESKMMLCGHCKCWVHAKCEKVTDEMYELLSKIPESVAFTCTKCIERYPTPWRTELERELQGCIRSVLNALVNSHTSMHLLRYRQQAVKPPELNPETEESQPSRRSPEGPDPPVLMEATTGSIDSPQDLESVQKKLALGCYKSVLEFGDDIAKIIQMAINSDSGLPESRKANSMVKAFFIRQMDRIFPWFKVKDSRFWERQMVTANSGLLPNAVLPPSLDHNYAQWQERQELSRAVQPLFTKKIIPAPCTQTPSGPHCPASPPLVHPSLFPLTLLSSDYEDSPDSPSPPGIGDNRQCALCFKYGDKNHNEEGRLLYMGQNEWTHINCALWSTDVFEDDDGSLKNVHLAVNRGKEMCCEKCQKPGATVSCCLTSCTNNYHFMCARQYQCIFLEDKKVYCSKHKDLIKGDVVSGFEVTRRVLVDIEGMSLKKKWLSGLEPDDVHMIIGSMTIDCLGKLTELSDCKRKLFPVGYQCSRVYWSTIDARKRCVYTCRILVCHPPVSECDLKSTMAPEENRTIAHSPPVADFPDPFESPRRSDTPSSTPKLRVYTRNRHPSYPPAGPRPTLYPGGTSRTQSHEVVTAGHSQPNPMVKNVDSRRHSSPALSPPQPLIRQRGVASSSQIISRPLTSPPPLIPSPARDPERSKHLGKELSNRDEEKRLFSTDKNRWQQTRDQSHKDTNKVRVLSRDQVSKDTHRNKSKEIRLKDRGQISAKELEQQKSLTKESSVKDTDRGRTVNRDHFRDPEKERQITKSSEKATQPITGSTNRDTEKSKTSSRSQVVEKNKLLNKDTGSRDSHKHRQHSRESGKDSGQGKDRSSRDSDKSRLHSRDSNHRSTERYKDSGKDSQHGSQFKSGGEIKSSRLTPAGQGQSSPPAGTAVVTDTDRHEKHRSMNQQLSSNSLSRHKPLSSSDFSQLKEKSNSGKVSTSGSGNVLSNALQKNPHIRTSGSPQPSFQKGSLQKSNDYVQSPIPAAAMKPMWPSRLSADEDNSKQGSNSPAAKDKHPKVKKSSSRELSKDRKTEKRLTASSGDSYSTLNNNNIKTKADTHNSSNNSKTQMIRNHDKGHSKNQGENENLKEERSSSKIRQMLSDSDKKICPDQSKPMQQTSLAMEKSQTKLNITNQLSVRDKSFKPPTSASVPTNPNAANTIDGISSTCHSTVTTSSVLPAGQGDCRSASATPFSSPSTNSDSSESETHAAEDGLHRRYSQGLLTEEDPEGQDDDHQSLDDKHHEDDSDGSGSAKRRYPRRSARARSNMFFGLTPFYGVCSYGNEDLHFYGSEEGAGPMVKKRSGSRKKSAEGQVDGADDMSSSSSSGDSGDDDSSNNPYYYNFTRTIINPGEGLPSIEGIDQCLGQGSQLQRFLKDEEQQKRQASTDEDLLSGLSLEQQHIGQLDGVDDGSESDTSICTTSTTSTTATSTPHKNTPKRRTRDRHSDKIDVNKDSDNSAGPGNANTREGRKHQKENCLPLGGKSQSQSQDPLDAQLSLSTDLLKSDSDNNNSDDCGNILPSDIMEFVLNTPSLSMQTLGQQAESSSSELLLDEGYVGVDVNRRKDILFDDYSQPLPSSESGGGVESSVNNSMSVEEPYLPLELPSDLSVLTTRSPTVSTGQNHTAGSLITDTSDRCMLGLTPDSDTIRGGKTSNKKRAENQHDTTALGNRDTHVTEGHMTPEQFIPSPAVGQAVEPTVNPDVPRAAGTPVLPSSPSIPLQGQKYLPAAGSPSPVTVAGPHQVSSTAVIKPGPDKLIVVNQQFQPLYVLQPVPNGVTQKISATGVMDTGSSAVLSSMTLTTGLNTSQQIFPATGKVLSTVAHPSQIHTFTGTTQTGFSTGIPSTTSGLLIGLSSQPQDQSQILVSEAGRPREFGPNLTIVSSPSTLTSSSILPSAHGKKRPISRLQPRKSKKLARSLARSDVGHPNMTLINFSSSQITSIPGQPAGLVELNTLSASQRKVPNIIKRPKPGGVMYLDPTSLLHQRIPSTPTGILGHDSSAHLIPCTVSSLNPSQSVLNVVSVPPSGVLGPGSVSLSTPVLSSTDITGQISNLLFKAGPHGLGLSEQPVVLQSAGAPLMSQLGSSVQTSIASSICVLPSQQTISIPVSQGETEGSNVQIRSLSQSSNKTVESSQNTVSLGHRSATHFNPAKGQVVGVFTRTHTLSPSQSSRTTPISRSNEQRQSNPGAVTTVTGGEKSKTKAKRSIQNPEVVGGKKHKAYQQLYSNPSVKVSSNSSSSKGLCSPEPMDTGKPTDKTSHQGKKKTSEGPGKILAKAKASHAKRAGSLVVSTPPGQEENTKDTVLDSKPKKGIIFEISSEDGFHIRCESIEEAWKSLTDKVQEARTNARLKELSFDGVNALKMLGVVHEAVVFLLEQLSGSRHCRSYRFRFHKPEESDQPPINPHGSARAELHHRRSVFDVFNFLASKHRQPPEYQPQEEDEEEGQLRVARRVSMELPLALRFKQLKVTCKESVGVYRSPIHGRGLFCKKSIDAGEMVIEYSGIVIRSVLTDKREKYYDGKGIGCYMFRIDDYEVVDATVHGNAARFINHSCEPNCYSRVITVDGQKHIVIFALRRIYCGEELTYDYKFPLEDTSNKLPCNCGAKRCRKFLN